MLAECLRVGETIVVEGYEIVPERCLVSRRKVAKESGREVVGGVG